MADYDNSDPVIAGVDGDGNATALVSSINCSVRDSEGTSSSASGTDSELGFEFVATMTIGSGCKVHLKAEELPKGTIICRVSNHYVTVIDGVINDTYDCSRNGTRCVYGYWKLKD